jgi:hypothetical protein
MGAGQSQLTYFDAVAELARRGCRGCLTYFYSLFLITSGDIVVVKGDNDEIDRVVWTRDRGC